MLIHTLDADEIASPMPNPISTAIRRCPIPMVNTLCDDHPRQHEDIRIPKCVRFHGHRRATSRRLIYDIDGAASILPTIRDTFSHGRVGTEGLFVVDIGLAEQQFPGDCAVVQLDRWAYSGWSPANYRV